MITLFSGTPGSGKSLHAAELLFSWSKKKPVILNFETNLSLNHKKNCMYVSDQELTPSFLINFSRKYWFDNGIKIKEDHILLLIDESQLLFNCRDWGNKYRAEWISFFTQHRKYGYHIVLIAQFDSMLDKQIRYLLEYEYIHRKIGNYGITGKAISLLSFGTLFCSIKYWYPKSQKISVNFFKGHKKLYKIYDTFNTFAQA